MTFLCQSLHSHHICLKSTHSIWITADFSQIFILLLLSLLPCISYFQFSLYTSHPLPPQISLTSPSHVLSPIKCGALIQQTPCFATSNPFIVHLFLHFTYPFTTNNTSKNTFFSPTSYFYHLWVHSSTYAGNLASSHLYTGRPDIQLQIHLALNTSSR